MPAPANVPADAPTDAPHHVTVEVAVESVAGALAAERGGADRIELCQSLGEGGLTPSAGLFAAVRAAVRLPVVVMVRPRSGDFLFDDGEFAVTRRDAAALRAAGADGIVTGALTADGRIDRERLAELRDLAGALPLTFHRAFDLCADADRALDVLLELGCARLLTSGQAANAEAGAAVIRRMVERAGSRLAVIAGAGVRDHNVAAIVAATGVREVHLSAGATAPSAMAFRRPGVPMGSPTAPDEYLRRHTDEAMVRRVVAALGR